jgi:hypothetical protein
VALVDDGRAWTLLSVLALVAVARVRSGSAAAPRIHAMKLPAWTLRLKDGTAELERAVQSGKQPEILAGIDDVSFWVGRIMGEGISAAAASPENQEVFEGAIAAVVAGRKAVDRARATLTR